MNLYTHKVHYYETDKMGITHHSNYIRWMEEARIFYLEQIGCGYDKLEQLGVISPVINVTFNYKKSTTFNDSIQIDLKFLKYNGIKFTFAYILKNEKSGEVIGEGETNHCFLNEEYKPLIMKRKFPQIDELLNKFSDKLLSEI